ncbi:MAG: protein kinase, partial [Chlamydiota bacterium]
MSIHNATPEKIGQYQILRSLKKGGMGEVFLAYDPRCRREVALKVIREDLKDHAVIKERFLREAHVAAQLAHPSIIPIFSIDTAEDRTFYTMPFVDGETLKEILKTTYDEDKKGEIKHPIGSSIHALTRIFLSICEAIAYTHSKKIIHRDLKPDNIIVGKYGEVMLLDWGLADFAGMKEAVFEEPNTGADYKDLTDPGKVPGTLNYLAPERVRGEPSEASMDIYSLGVILYQLLTLRIPFQRSTIKSFRKTMHLETLIDPVEAAPYRDIPQHLADIAKRCLKFSPEERFPNVDEMISELKNFLEGHPEWIPTTIVKIESKEDWEFQEMVLLTKHLAITRSPEVMEWVCMMISRASFTGNTKMETVLQLGEECQGIGFLLGVPDAQERKGISAGYCLWLGEESCLIHNNVEVMAIPEGLIKNGVQHHIAIEKVENDFNLWIDHQLICRYISHVPSLGTHIGILCRDANFEMGPIKMSVGSQNATVNCLAIPDAFLANKNFAKALLEYRRIANSFAGRVEAREAMFRSGITLIEEALTRKKKEERERHYLLALEEFGKLRFTPGAPLEYLGKSLVYKATREIEEEVKCLELCVRKYHRHPLLHLIQDHIAFRMHESASRDRMAAYHFALLALRQLPHIFGRKDHELLIDSLKKHLETPPFISSQSLACLIAFWIPRPIVLIEMIESSDDAALTMDAAYALLSLGFHRWVS